MFFEPLPIGANHPETTPYIYVHVYIIQRPGLSAFFPVFIGFVTYYGLRARYKILILLSSRT